MLPKKRFKKEPFRFLDLPGELRNRVYEYVVQNDDFMRVAPIPSISAPTHHPLRYISIRYKRDFAITQVCGQMRKEVRPLWLERTPLVVLPKDMPRFLTDFVNGHGKLAAANVSFAYPPHKTLDILPWFKLAQESSHIRFEPLYPEDFAYEWDTIASAVRQILTEHPKLGDRISKIFVRAPGSVVVLFKRGHHDKCMEPWTGFEIIRPWNVEPQQKLLKKYGLSDLRPCLYIDDGDKWMGSEFSF